jgi:hypothetical protein
MSTGGGLRGILGHADTQPALKRSFDEVYDAEQDWELHEAAVEISFHWPRW